MLVAQAHEVHHATIDPLALTGELLRCWIKCEGHWSNALCLAGGEIWQGCLQLMAAGCKLTIISNDCVYIRVSYQQELTTGAADQGSVLIIQCINTKRAQIIEVVSLRLSLVG